MDTRTYQEVQQPGMPFDWLQFFAQDEYSVQDLDAASTASGSWVTCACGNLCAAIPRDSMGSPLDDELRTLGLEFHDIIYNWWVSGLEWPLNTTVYKPKALALLQYIEHRAAHLIEQLKQKEEL